MSTLDDFGCELVFLKGDLKNIGKSILFTDKNNPEQFDIITYDPYFKFLVDAEKKEFSSNVYPHKPLSAPFVFLFSSFNKINTDTEIELDSSSESYNLLLTKTVMWFKNYLFKNIADVKQYQTHVKNSFKLQSNIKYFIRYDSKDDILKGHNLIKYINHQVIGYTNNYLDDTQAVQSVAMDYFPKSLMDHLNPVLKNYSSYVDNALKDIYIRHLSQILRPKYTMTEKIIIDEIDDYIISKF